MDAENIWNIKPLRYDICLYLLLEGIFLVDSFSSRLKYFLCFQSFGSSRPLFGLRLCFNILWNGFSAVCIKLRFLFYSSSSFSLCAHNRNDRILLVRVIVFVIFCHTHYVRGLSYWIVRQYFNISFYVSCINCILDVCFDTARYEYSTWNF